MPDPMQPVADACSDHNLHRVPGAVLAAMRAAPGRYVTMQTLRDAIEAVTGGRSTEDGVRRAIVRIRAAGVAVECCQGVGYRVEAGDPERNGPAHQP